MTKAVPTASSAPAQKSTRRRALVAFTLAAAVIALPVGFFVRTLPLAVARAAEGAHKSAAAACELLSPAPSNPVLGMLPQPAPDFTLPDYLGRPLTLSSLRGEVVLVNYWATWCNTCVVEMPSLEKLSRAMAGRPFRIVAVSVDDEWPEVRNFFKGGTGLQVLLDPSRATAKRYGTEKFPESFLVDKAGNIQKYVISDRDWSHPAVQACIETLLQD